MYISLHLYARAIEGQHDCASTLFMTSNLLRVHLTSISTCLLLSKAHLVPYPISQDSLEPLPTWKTIDPIFLFQDFDSLARQAGKLFTRTLDLIHRRAGDPILCNVSIELLFSFNVQIQILSPALNSFAIGWTNSLFRSSVISIDRTSFVGGQQARAMEQDVVTARPIMHRSEFQSRK